MLAVAAFGTGSDVYIQGRNSGNTAPVQTTVAPAINSLLGFNASKAPINVTIGANLTLSSGVLDANGSGGTPGGSTTQVQYNSSSSFAGAAGFVFDGTSIVTLGVAGASVGELDLKNATSGTIKIVPVTGALGTSTLLAPATSSTIAVIGNKLSIFAATSSAELAGIISDETGSGALVFGTSPTFTTPALGTPSSGVATNLTGTASGLAVGSAAALSVSGQTGLVTVTGLASTNRVKTVRDAADTLLELGGSYTPSGTWTSMTLVTPALGTPASGVLTNTTTATATQADNSTKPASTAYVDRQMSAPAVSAQTASFTFVAADQFRTTTINNASATTATIPPNSSVNFPVGTWLILVQKGAGACTWTAGSGVTKQSRASAYVTAGTYSISMAFQESTDTWYISGDVTP